jgi:proline iminopeptidase
MRSWFGFAGAILSVAIGIVTVVAVGWAFAPSAPSLVTLALVPLVAGLAVAAGLSWWIARRVRWRASRTAVVASLLTLLPFVGIAAWVALSPTPTLAAPARDPRGQPAMVALPTGSTLATWSLAGEGTRRTTPVVFLHGGPGYYVKKRDLAMGAAFRRAGFDTVYYDQAGSGASAGLPTADYNVARQVADLDALRAKLGAERIVLWGESWGATLAAHYALAHPERVAGAVFSSPGEYPGMAEVAFDFSGVMPSKGAEPPPKAMVLYGLLTRAPHLAESWMDQPHAHQVNNAMQLQDLAGPGPRCKGSTWSRTPRERTAQSSVYTLRRLLLDSLAQPDQPARTFDVPALVVRGDCDFIPVAVADRYARAFPRARIVRVAGAGHSLLDHEARFVDESGRFAAQALAGLR